MRFLNAINTIKLYFCLDYGYDEKVLFLHLILKTNSMSISEQEALKATYYSEAIRYMDNAKEYLKNAKKEGNFYHDKKYVKTACGTAYNGLLVALDCYLALKGIDKPKKKQRKSIEYYQSNITRMDKKMLDYLNNAYEILHLWGYYDGIGDVRVVNAGFDNAYNIIEKIKPAV
jgi:hypothetical protein